MANFTHNLAIAIGINQYQNGIAELKTAKPDAEELANLLRDEYQYQVELITDDTDRKPTLKELENLLTKWLPEQLQPPAENNRLLFYFAGHGMPLESDDGPRGFLLPQDADPKDSKTFLPMQVLHDALVALPCHHLLVILDCCFAGTFRWASTRKMIPIPETIHREHYDRFIRYPAWQAITSAAHNQEALDFLSDKRGISKKSQDDEKKHSPFAEALFEALQHGDPDEKGRRYKKADLTKDGVITAPELYLYLRDNVETRSNERQTPGLYSLKKHDRGEYIFHDPNFDRESLSEADPIDETNNPYRGLKPFEEEHARFFFGRQELIENLYARIAAPDHSLTVVLGVSGSGKSSLVKAGLIPYLRELSKPPINDPHQWHILNPIRPGESPFAALARTVWAIADMPTTVELDSLGFLSEKLNQKTKELNTQVANASINNRETSRTTQRLKQEAEKFAEITTTWNQDTHAAKQLLIVEHFETLYALCQSQGEPESQQQQQLKQVFLACLNPLTEQLQSAPNSFIEIVKAWSQKHPGVNLLLVIDQFEELITLSRKAQPNPQSDTPEEWQQFLQLLETTLAANLPQLRLIVTLRSDFEPRFLNSEALKSYWTKARFPVRAMRSDELRQAIEGPASEMALYFEPANLVDRLIDEVGQMPGALPLLSFTLSEFYIKLAQKWRDGESSDRALTIDADFDKEGGVAGSLTRKANEEYEKLGEAAQGTMRRVMLRMLTLEGGETARRRVPESELVYPTLQESDRVTEVVKRLVEARLLVKGQLETGEPYVEAAHDFLVRGWDKLQEWLKESQEDVTLQHRLTTAITDWSNGRGILWFEEVDRLAKLEKVLDSETENWLNRLEQEFVTQSILERQNRIKKLEEDLRISEERRLAAELELNSVVELRQFEIEKGIFPLQNATRIAHELLEWAQKNNRTLRDYPTVSPLFTLQTILDHLYEHESFFYSQETDAFWDWLTQSAVPETIPAQFETGHGESLLIRSPNGQYFITLEAEVTQPSRCQWRIWQQPQEPLTDVLETETEIDIDPAHFSRSGNVPRFSESGKIIVLKNFSRAEFYNLAGDLVGKFSASPNFSIEQIILSPDDSKIAIIERLGGGEGTQRLHFMAQYRQTKETSRFQRDQYFYIDEVSHHRVYGSMRFTADSQFLVTASSQDTNINLGRVWHLEPHICLKLADSEQLPTVPLQRNLEFRWQQGKAECLDQDQIIAVLAGPEDWFERIILSPQQTWLISIDRNSSVRLWQTSGKLIANFSPWRGVSRQIVLSPNDSYCALVERIGVSIISLSDVLSKSQVNPNYFLVPEQTPQDEIIISKIQGNLNQFSSLSFSSDEERIVTVGMERTIRIWDLKARQLAELNLSDPQIARIVGTPLDMGDGFDPKVVFSLDGQWIIFTYKSRGFRPALMWQVETLGDLIERSRKRSSDYWQDEIGKKIKRLIRGIETQTQ